MEIFVDVLTEKNESDDEINALNCRSQWNKVKDCTKSRRGEYNSDPTINLNQIDSFLKDLSACYTNQLCNNPFPNVSQRNVRRSCAKVIALKINRKIMSCVRRQFSDFDLPDYDEIAYLLNRS
uniref:Uncharacterized protein n=1 Tax=Romanomermis culicivorax TaxID=13658 RepID=A0A915KEY3_ROMCU